MRDTRQAMQFGLISCTLRWFEWPKAEPNGWVLSPKVCSDQQNRDGEEKELGLKIPALERP